MSDWIQVIQIVSNLAIVGTFIVYWCLLRRTAQARDVAREGAWRDLLSAFTHINDYINTNKDVVKHPYPKLKAGQANGILLFHHLNLLLRFYVHRSLWTPEEQDGFDHWSEVVFFKWVEDNSPLGEDLVTIVEFGDLYPKGFLTWIKEKPAYARLSRSARN